MASDTIKPEGIHWFSTWNDPFTLQEVLFMHRVLSVLVSFLLLMGVSAVAFADSEITVNGSGEVLVPADAAIVSLGVSAVEHEVLAAQAKANEAIASIRAALISGGICETDINTDYINIYAMYDYSSGREELTAYNANSTLAIRVNDIEKVGEVIDTAFGAGANTLNGISFSATDTSEAREKAMRAAVDDARAKAEILADAAGLRIFGIEEIREQGTYSSDRGAGNFFKSEQAMGSSADTIVQAAKLSVSSSITVTFKVN